MAVGNLPKVKYLSVDGMNLFDVLKYDYLVMTEPTVRRLEGALGK
jgi:ribosomal protein L4